MAIGNPKKVVALHPPTGIYFPYAINCGTKAPQAGPFAWKSTVHCHKNH